MLKISPAARLILDGLNNRYASQTYKRFYGKSPYRNWQIMLDRLFCSLESNTYEFGTGLIYPSQWGQIIYSRSKIGDDILTTIDNFRFDYRLLHNWFTNAIYPSAPATAPSRQIINSFSYMKPFRTIVLANGNAVYAVQSDTHLYSIADKNKNLVLNKWFNSLDFPLNQTIGNLHIIGYGTIDKIPYYIDEDLKLHHGAEIAQIQKMQNCKLEGKKNRKNIIRLNEYQFKQMLVECITKIMKEIA